MDALGSLKSFQLIGIMALALSLTLHKLFSEEKRCKRQAVRRLKPFTSLPCKLQHCYAYNYQKASKISSAESFLQMQNYIFQKPSEKLLL